MHLSNIVLEPTSRNVYDRLNRLWYNRPSKYAGARIVQPVKSRSFTALFKEFLKNEQAKRVSIHNGTNWDKWYIDEINPSELRDMASIAKECTSPRGGLELHFDPEGNGDFRDYIKLCFVQRGTRIISFEAQFPYRHAGFFNWARPHSYDGPSLDALWDPHTRN